MTCEYCDNTPLTDSGECLSCYAEMKRQQEYHSALFKSQRIPYTVEEIMDAYSEPCEYQKRIGALERLGL